MRHAFVSKLAAPSVFSLLVFWLGTILLGQTFRGGISGSVMDTSGAAIPGASVKIVHSGTGLAREQATTSAGEFNFPDLPTGLYTVAVTMQGFQSQHALRQSIR